MPVYGRYVVWRVLPLLAKQGHEQNSPNIVQDINRRTVMGMILEKICVPLQVH